MLTAMTTPPPGTRAIIYTRISSDREGGGLGIDRQREDCQRLAAQLSLDVVAIYEDNDLSAYSGKPRPGYTALLDELRNGRADVVLAWHTDRLHRSPAELEAYMDVCEPRRIETRTVKAGHLDLTTATGRMLARQLGNLARYEVEQMVERQRRKRDQMAEQGRPFGGQRPFGYDPDGITIREDEAAAVREAAEAILAGASLRAIAADWNERGLQTSTGGEWRPAEIRRMLLRPRNAGIVKHRGQEAGPASWPAILDEPLWRSVRAVLEDPARRTVSGNGRKWLGSGLYLCGVCGLDMRCATSSTRERPSYRCRAMMHVSRRCDLLDDYVALLILGRVSQSDAADLLAEREDPVDVRGAQTDMREARATLDQLAAALGAGEMDMHEWRAASAAARARRERAEEMLSRAVRANPVAGLVTADEPAAVWGGMDLSRRRAVVAWLMTVTVHPARKGRLPGGARLDTDTIEIAWR